MALDGGGLSMGMGKVQSLMLMMLLSSSVPNKGSVGGSCSAIVSEECRKGVTCPSVMNAVVVAVVDNMSVYHSDCMCNSRCCVGIGTVLN